MKYDAIVVLGGGLTGNGSLTEPSKDRVEKASELFLTEEIKIIILCGGKTEKENASESEVMKGHLCSLGIAENVIIEENLSKTTIGNAYYLKRIISSMDIRRIAVVTSDFHLTRARMIFDKMLGRRYEVTFIPTKHKKIPTEIIDRERMIYGYTVSAFRLFDDGDAEGIMDLARSFGCED